MEERTAETLKSLAVTTIPSIRRPVATLSGGQRQSVAVAKAVQWNSKLVILDEPTAALGVAQTEQVLALVRRLGEQGLAVVIISHNLHDVFETANRITVLRLGRNVGVFERADDLAAGGRRRRSPPASRRRSPASRRPQEPPRERGRRRRAASRRCAGGRGGAHGGLPRAASALNIRTGNLGIVPIVVGEIFIVVFFGFTATNFFTAVNFGNIIIQMAGTTMLAYGVVFVLLLGEIDLSIGYVAGIGALTVAELQLPGQRAPDQRPARDPDRDRRLRGDRLAAGLDRRLRRRALVRRHARAAT